MEFLKEGKALVRESVVSWHARTCRSIMSDPNKFKTILN